MNNGPTSASNELPRSVEPFCIDGRLRSARKEVRSSRSLGSLHWLHWLILGLSLAITLFAYNGARTALVEKDHARLNKQVDEFMTLFAERIQRYEDALWAGTAALHARGDRMDRAGWRAFARHLQIEKRLPGVLGIGVIDIIDDAQLDAYVALERTIQPEFDVHGRNPDRLHFPITFIEPEAINAKAIGLDLGFEKNRRDGIIRALRTGKAIITDPIGLIQDERHTPGFLFIAPFNSDMWVDSDSPDTSINRLVYIPFVAQDLIHGALGKRNRLVQVRISDGDTIMHDELSHVTARSSESLSAQRRFEQHGRSWVFDFVTSPDFNQRTVLQHPVLVLLGGIGIDILLLALFMTLSRSERRMSDSAAELSGLSRQLEVKASKLERSNAELQSFAYVASHDLKTPLRGIDFLASCLEEDLEPYLNSQQANPDVSRNLSRLGKQIQRMNHLISGVLDYAMVGTSEDALESVNVDQLVRDIAGDLRLGGSQISIGSNLPVLCTYAVRLEQVFSNLITNAIKYHDNPERIHVSVSCRLLEGWYEFSVCDNGPGIDTIFHDRIFDVFQTLQSRDEIESTGVGLSIVRKSVEELGGSVEINSSPGNGSDFIFTWPATTQSDDQTRGHHHEN